MTTAASAKPTATTRTTGSPTSKRSTTPRTCSTTTRTSSPASFDHLIRQTELPFSAGVRSGRVRLLAVRDHDRGVHIQHHQIRPEAAASGHGGRQPVLELGSGLFAVAGHVSAGASRGSVFMTD